MTTKQKNIKQREKWREQRIEEREKNIILWDQFRSRRFDYFIFN